MARRTVQNFLEELPTEPESTLAIAAIVMPPSQPRRYFDSDKIQQLANSIKEYGILEPLLVRPIPNKPNIYELVAGERRYRAAVQLGLETVPIIIRELDDQQALAIALVENLTREDLNPVEEAEGTLQLLEMELGLERSQVTSMLYRMENEKKGKITHNVMGNEMGTQIQTLFEGLGQNWLSFTANRLPILNLPEEILEALRQGELAYTKAKAIARIKDEKQRQQLLKEAIEQNLSLSQIRKQIQELQAGTVTHKAPTNIDQTVKRLKSSRIWESDQKKWKKLQDLLQQIDDLIKD